MRKIVLLLLFILSQVVSPAMAQNDDSSVIVKVYLSKDMIFRADNVHKNIRARVGSRGSSGGFSEDGNYGMSELENLVEDLEKELSKKFRKEDWVIAKNLESSPNYVLQVLILDARNNRPTPEQLSHSAFDGEKEGGAILVAKIINPENITEFRAYNYEYFDRGRSPMIWGGAKKAFSQFSKKLVKKLSSDDIVFDGSVNSLN